MHEVLVNCLFKLAQEKVWLGELTIAVDLGRKAIKQTKKNPNLVNFVLLSLTGLYLQQIMQVSC